MNFIPAEQHDTPALSDIPVAELQAADTIVIGTPSSGWEAMDGRAARPAKARPARRPAGREMTLLGRFLRALLDLAGILGLHGLDGLRMLLSQFGP